MHTRLVHPRLGEVDIMRRSNSSRFSACWRAGRFRITGPSAATDRQFVAALDSLAPRLIAFKESRPAPVAAERDLVLDGLTIRVVRQSLRPGSVILSPALPHSTLSVGSGVDLSSASGREIYARAMRTIAHRVAPQLLLPRARAIAARLGCAPARWTVSRGSTVLGRCTSARFISISSMCVFLPWRLRDYIVCHELAHLTHMNHSEAFHRLLDSYLGGEERSLVNELKNYRWPIPR